ncbi:Sec-independent protein translocase TatB [Cryobacterium psychrophilum]|uniref:Sec-independent protein translocase TatB n=1 Tax=Cryobacterium psychrophilum TaxID=41988 RepID=A0A4Y8KS32_9MICO|nr:Sec-independent protein translocase TatB [Cryobacterium psychrophilum]TFD80783.1 Sec-independent protein translocase TatB [Cryobacterium psychrophilum]
MFGLTFEKILIIGIIAVFLLGPDKLPHYAAQLARLVRQLRDMANGAKERIRDEMGPEFDELDWKKLDPRQYDPRRIIREALTEEEPLKEQSATLSRASPAAASLLATTAGTAALTPLTPAALTRAPFDLEAT